MRNYLETLKMIIHTTAGNECSLSEEFVAGCNFLAPFNDQSHCLLTQQHFDDLSWLHQHPPVTSLADMIRLLQVSDFYGIDRYFEEALVHLTKNVGYYYQRRQLPLEWYESLTSLSDDLQLALNRRLAGVSYRLVQQWHMIDHSQGLLLAPNFVAIDQVMEARYCCSNPEGTLIVMGGIVVTHGYRRLLPLQKNEIPIVVDEQVIGILDEKGRDLQTGAAVAVTIEMLIAAVQVCYYHHRSTEYCRDLGGYLEDLGIKKFADGNIQLHSLSPHRKYGIYVDYNDYREVVCLWSFSDQRMITAADGGQSLDITIWSPSGRTGLVFDDRGVRYLFIDGEERQLGYYPELPLDSYDDLSDRHWAAINDRYLVFEKDSTAYIVDFDGRCSEILHPYTGDNIVGIYALSDDRFLIINGGESHSASIYKVDNSLSLNARLQQRISPSLSC